MGIWRAQFIKRNGVYGCWVSKPNFDVTTAAPGDFLVDTSSQVFQCIAKGDTLILTEGQGAIGAGTYSASVALPVAFAGFSNIAMIATYYMVSNSGQFFSTQNMTNTYLTFNIVNGVLRLFVTFRSNGGTGTPSVSFDHRAAWTIYRSQF
jgi:hypothetical protein